MTSSPPRLLDSLDIDHDIIPRTASAGDNCIWYVIVCFIFIFFLFLDVAPAGCKEQGNARYGQQAEEDFEQC